MRRVAVFVVVAAASAFGVYTPTPGVELLPVMTMHVEESNSTFGRDLCLDVYNGWCPELNRPTPIQY